MALKKETISLLAKLAKIKVEDLESAIKDTTEVEVTIDDKVTSYSEDELKTFKTNTYNDGKKAGVEMNVDEVKKELGLDFQGKTIKGLLDAHKTHVLKDANKEPTEKVKELEAKVSTLQKTITTQEGQLVEKDKEVVGVKTKGELYKHIPVPGESGPALGQDDVIQLMQANGYEFKLEEGKLKAYKGGTLLQDKLGEAVPAKDVVSAFMKEKKLVQETPPAPGGRGAGDQRPPSGYVKLSELKESFTKQGKSTLGDEFSKAVEAAVKDNKDFDMKS